MAKPDGGPAFPKTSQSSDPVTFGMTLRDYFAGKAMAALLSQMTYGNQGQHCAMYDPNDRAQAITLAHLSYQAAAAMLNEREKE